MASGGNRSELHDRGASSLRSFSLLAGCYARCLRSRSPDCGYSHAELGAQTMRDLVSGDVIKIDLGEDYEERKREENAGPSQMDVNVRPCLEASNCKSAERRNPTRIKTDFVNPQTRGALFDLDIPNEHHRGDTSYGQNQPKGSD